MVVEVVVVVVGAKVDGIAEGSTLFQKFVGEGVVVTTKLHGANICYKVLPFVTSHVKRLVLTPTLLFGSSSKCVCANHNRNPSLKSSPGRDDSVTSYEWEIQSKQIHQSC